MCFLCKQNEVFHTIYLHKTVYVLLFKESLFSSCDLPSTFPSKVTSLLQEFFSFFPKEEPSRLPPLRGVEH